MNMMNPNSKLIAVAIDNNKSSQHALKWTIENLLVRGQTILLVHVRTKPNGSSSPYSSSSSLARSRSNQSFDKRTKELILPFHIYCRRKDIQCQDIVLDGADVVKALLEYVGRRGIEVLVVGAPRKGRDIPASALKGVPDFCTVYVISKGKISSTKAAARPAPPNHPMHFGRRSMDIPSYMSLESYYQSSQDYVVDVEMRRLKMELKQTMEMYSTVPYHYTSARPAPPLSSSSVGLHWHTSNMFQEFHFVKDGSGFGYCTTSSVYRYKGIYYNQAQQSLLPTNGSGFQGGDPLTEHKHSSLKTKCVNVSFAIFTYLLLAYL